MGKLDVAVLKALLYQELEMWGERGCCSGVGIQNWQGFRLVILVNSEPSEFLGM